MGGVRILWHSNAPWSPTGYGVQTQIWVPRLAALGHEIAISAFYGLKGAPIQWQGHMVYPAGQHPYGGDIVGQHARHFKADLVIVLMDQWTLPKDSLKGLHVAYWMPVDCSPLGTRDYGGLETSDRKQTHLIALTRFGQKQLAECGWDSLYVPHGIDTSLWVPPVDKRAAKEALGLTGKFVIFTDAANQSLDRKGYDVELAAFSRFRQRHPDSLLMIHSLQTTANGMDLPYTAARMGCLDGIAWTDQHMLLTGLIRPETLRANYGVADLYSGASLAEGFGLPALQALSCGVPVVSTRGTGENEHGPGKHGAGAWGSAMWEVVGPAAYNVKSEPYWRPGHDSWWDKPLLAEMVKTYEKAYQKGPAYSAKCEASRKRALVYDVDRVLAEYWIPALKELESRL